MSSAAKLLTKDGARRIVANVTKLPEFYVEGNTGGSNVRFWG